jgi:hypothetical protein
MRGFVGFYCGVASANTLPEATMHHLAIYSGPVEHAMDKARP